MGTLLLIPAIGALVLAGLAWLILAGFRNGDRPLDATVSAQLRDAGQPDEPRPVVVAEVRNPSATPVMVGLAARPAGLTRAILGGGSISVPGGRHGGHCSQASTRPWASSPGEGPYGWPSPCRRRAAGTG